VNIRTQLIRSCTTIGLAVISVAAISATNRVQDDARTMPRAGHATTHATAVDEPLSAVWLPAVAVRARAEPLDETWLPTIHVDARIEHLAMEDAPTHPHPALAIAAGVPVGIGN
jgi:hypothetical protein